MSDFDPGYIYVSYIHYGSDGPYRVRRNFDTREAAQEFIDNNAMVWPLPGVRLENFKGDIIA